MAGINITLGGNFAALNQLQAKVSETVAKIKTGFAERIGHRMLDGLLDAARRMPEVVGRAITAASDYQETVSKVGVVFDESAESILSWSEASSKAFGQSRSEALAAASDYGNLFRAMGITTGQSAEMSKRLVELAADLASFNNTSVPDAIQAIGAALRGEAEPIRRYGVLLDDATLKARALADGIYDGKGSLEPAARALAAYGVVLEQTSTAQGDFARTADGLANSQRILRAEIEDAVAAAGNGLLPAVGKLANATKEVDMEFIGETIGESISNGADLLMSAVSKLETAAGMFRMFDGGVFVRAFAELRMLGENAVQMGGISRGNAALQEFNATNLAKEISTRQELAEKLVELETAKEMLRQMAGKVMNDARPEIAEAMRADLEATLKLLDGQAERLLAITDAQLSANQAKRDAAAAEVAHAKAIEEANKAYDKAKKTFTSTVEKAEERRRAALPIEEQIAELDGAEKKLRESFNVAIRTNMADASGEEIVRRIEAARTQGFNAVDHAESLQIATRLVELEEKRASLMREQQEKQRDLQAETEKQRAKAVADYDSELAIIRAKVEGNQTLVAQLEREAEIRQRIADMVAAGVDRQEAIRRAEAMVAAQDDLKRAERQRENAKALAEAERIAAGGPESRIASNEGFLDRLRELRGGLDGLSYRSTLTVDSMQRIGGGGGFAGTDATLDYQRRQTDYLRDIGATLRDMKEHQMKEQLD